MAKSNGNDLYEDKFARVWSEVRRIDELRQTDAHAARNLSNERDRRLDQRMDGQETAVAAALAAAEKAVTAALVASEKAVDKAEVAQKAVNETQNEFRGTLRDQATNFMPRNETENLIRELRGLIASQGETLSTLRSRIDVGPPSLSAIQARSDEQIGARRGALDTRTIIFAGIAALATLLSIGFAIAALVKP
jgi:hypothetical protein